MSFTSLPSGSGSLERLIDRGTESQQAVPEGRGGLAQLGLTLGDNHVRVDKVVSVSAVVDRVVGPSLFIQKDLAGSEFLHLLVRRS